MGITIKDVRKQVNEYKEGSLVIDSTDDGYGILLQMDVLTYNVLKLPIGDDRKPYLLYYGDGITIDEVKNKFEIVTNPKGYNMTITIGD